MVEVSLSAADAVLLVFSHVRKVVSHQYGLFFGYLPTYVAYFVVKCCPNYMVRNMQLNFLN